MRSTRFYRLFAMVLAVVTVALPLNLDLFAAADASFMGRVTGADGLAPRTGAVVALVLGEGDAIYRSEPTDARGAFKVGGAPAGTYRVVVETESGAFLASDGIALKNGENGPVSLALQPNRQDAPATPPANPPQVRRGGLAPWAKWVIVGGIAVAGAIIINSLGDDDETSPFSNN